MSQRIDLGNPDNSDTGSAHVGYAYYDPGSHVADPSSGSVITICLDCDDGNHAPGGHNRAHIRDTSIYGSHVPHIYCDDCGNRMTGAGGN